MASTLPPTPSVVTTVPVVSFPGESESAAKNDPTGPQALMRKTREMEVQGQVDSKFDSNVSPHEGFDGRMSPFLAIGTELLKILVIGLGAFSIFRFLASYKKKRSSPILLFFVVLLFIYGMVILSKNRSL